MSSEQKQSTPNPKLKEFQSLLDTIQRNVRPNLDTGTFGAPSAVRLQKLLDKGFGWFEATLPEGAIRIPEHKVVLMLPLFLHPQLRQ